MKTITPVQRIKNIKNALDRTRDSKRHRGRAWAIRAAQSQLAEIWVKYRQGELEPITDEIPF